MLHDMETNRESQLEVEIAKVKEELAGLGDLRPGSLSTQYNVCGSPNCKCKADPPQTEVHTRVAPKASGGAGLSRYLSKNVNM
jgi:hypothetical protein